MNNNEIIKEYENQINILKHSREELYEEYLKNSNDSTRIYYELLELYHNLKNCKNQYKNYELKLNKINTKKFNKFFHSILLFLLSITLLIIFKQQILISLILSSFSSGLLYSYKNYKYNKKYTKLEENLKLSINSEQEEIKKIEDLIEQLFNKRKDLSNLNKEKLKCLDDIDNSISKYKTKIEQIDFNEIQLLNNNKQKVKKINLKKN